VRQTGALDRPFSRVKVKSEFRTHSQFLGAVLERTYSKLRPLKVGKYADRAARIGLDLADYIVTRFLIFVRPMAHVEPEHIGTGLVEGADHLVVTRCGTERRNDLYIPEASHLSRSLLALT